MWTGRKQRRSVTSHFVCAMNEYVLSCNSGASAVVCLLKRAACCFSHITRQCMKVRSWTTPLVCATINTSCSGTSIVVAAFTSWTPPPAQSLCCATRDRPSLKSACTTLSSSKVLENASQIYYLFFPSIHVTPEICINPLHMNAHWRLFVHRLQCVSCVQWRVQQFVSGHTRGQAMCLCWRPNTRPNWQDQLQRWVQTHMLCLRMRVYDTIHENVDKRGVTIITEAPAYCDAVQYKLCNKYGLFEASTVQGIPVILPTFMKLNLIHYDQDLHTRSAVEYEWGGFRLTGVCFSLNFSFPQIQSVVLVLLQNFVIQNCILLFSSFMALITSFFSPTFLLFLYFLCFSFHSQPVVHTPSSVPVWGVCLQEQPLHPGALEVWRRQRLSGQQRRGSWAVSWVVTDTHTQKTSSHMVLKQLPLLLESDDLRQSEFDSQVMPELNERANSESSVYVFIPTNSVHMWVHHVCEWVCVSVQEGV